MSNLHKLLKREGTYWSEWEDERGYVLYMPPMSRPISARLRYALCESAARFRAGVAS